jgi:ribonucleoside-diphosphate reductase alpha chain
MTQLITDPAVSPSTTSPTLAGLTVKRRYSHPGVNPLDEVTWDKRRTVITNPDGSVVYKMDDVEVPQAWSQLATDIVVSKYFRKAGIKQAPGHETSVRQVVHRIAHTLRVTGEQQGGYFATAEDADAFESELAYMLVHQIGAFTRRYGSTGPAPRGGTRGSGGPAGHEANGGRDRTPTAPPVLGPPTSRYDDLMSIFEPPRTRRGSSRSNLEPRGRMEKLAAAPHRG